jgi:GNAT superfamily N-acetyltransferase
VVLADDVVIRKALPADAGRLIELLGLLFAIETDFTFDQDRQQRGLEMMLGEDDRRCLMVAELDRQIVGMCSGQLLVSTAEGGLKAIVEDLVLDKDFRGQGIGRQLLWAIETWAVKQGAKRMDLLADRRNSPALSFYRNDNWKTTELVGLQKKL